MKELTITEKEFTSRVLQKRIWFVLQVQTRAILEEASVHGDDPHSRYVMKIVEAAMTFPLGDVEESQIEAAAGQFVERYMNGHRTGLG